MKFNLKHLCFALCLFTSVAYSQTITVDDTGYTAQNLADLLLDSSCIEATNVSYSSSQSVAYFNGNASSFPISEGIIIRTGLAKQTEGLYNETNLSTEVNTDGDTVLEDISTTFGQEATITDTAFFQFDFTPISSDFSFDFVFASNEYGQYQCGFSDVFAFLLTDLTTGTTTNLAIVPGTTTPVAVTTIRDNAYNSSCTSINPEYFSTYNVDNPAASTLNMRGHTTSLSAVSTLTPNNPYRIRLVIGDYNNSGYDSAVFVDAGSFNTEVSLGEDTIMCTGDSLDLNTGLNETEYNHTWTLDGTVISGETNNSITVTTPGTYAFTAVKGGTTCEITDEIVISELTYSTPNNLSACESSTSTYEFNLTANNETILGIDDVTYDLFYYATLADIASNTPITNPANYPTTGAETVYIKIFNTVTNNFCDVELSFDLTIDGAVTATQPDNINVCNDSMIIEVGLTGQNTQILNGLLASEYTISYYLTEDNALNGAGSIGDSHTLGLSDSPVTIWAQLQSNNNPECLDVTSFDIIVNELPEVSTIEDVIECSQYTLPNIDHGNYYDGPGGTGTMYNAGDVIDIMGTYYIFNGPDANGCTNESSFTLIFIEQYTVGLDHCGEFVVPIPPEGAFYTASGGPTGTGTEIPSGTIITTSQTIYYYAEVNNVFCRDDAFPITIHPLPLVDELEDVVTCINYTLQPLTNGSYFNSPGGVDPITDLTLTASQTVYIYNGPDANGCVNESSFQVDIINNAVPVVACGSYTLPALEVGGYFYSPNGVNPVPASEYTITDTTTPTTIYIYAETSTAPNCTADYSFTVTIKPVPPVDSLEDITKCVDDPFILPTLTNGQYFTEPSRSGTMLNPGDAINATATVYINNLVDGCDNETSFTVNITPLPLVDNFTDVFVCDPYTLPTLTNGTYYTESGANGTMLNAGDVISTTQTIYIYNEQPTLATCTAETVFQVNILGLNVGDFEDQPVCDSYTLPTLTLGNYYTESGGNGTMLNAGDIITTTQTIYVYAENGDRFLCTDEDEFTVTISTTPSLPSFANQNVCESYTLPTLDTSMYNVNYYYQSNGEELIPASQYTITEPGTHIIYVYASSFGNATCTDEKMFSVTIHPLLDLEVEGGIICVDPVTNETLRSFTLDSGLSPTEFTVNWYLETTLVGTGPTYEAVEEGVYTIETIKLTADVPPNCNYNITTVEVSKSSQAIADIIISEDFADEASITVNVTGGFGEYEFALDEGTFQSSNVFNDVSSGEHTITIRDVLGSCQDLVLTATVMKYPKFFTPNGDGENERWNIWSLSSQQNAQITIFDRFGKAITQIKTAEEGWDGTYLGNKMPETDYWFVLDYIDRNGDEKVFKSHFSLRRYKF